MESEELPLVVVLATGGTIAGRSDDRLDVVDYRVEATGAEIVASVPEVGGIARVEVRDLARVGSHEFDAALWMALAAAVRDALARPEVRGVVVLHGTDTLESSAFVLDLVIDDDKPVVVTGAMRPGTSVSPDGPLNLVQSVALAVDEAARGRGVLVVAGDRILSGYYAEKTNSIAGQAFATPEQGFLGGFVGVAPLFYFEPARPAGRRPIEVAAGREFPSVAIVSAHPDCGTDLLDAAAVGHAGIVIDASGSGWPPPSFERRLRELVAEGVPVVVAGSAGYAFRDAGMGTSAGLLDARKARIALMLDLARG